METQHYHLSKLLLNPVLKLVRFLHNGKKMQFCSTERVISYLSKIRKIFERLIYNKMFGYFMESDLIFHNQSGLSLEIYALSRYYLTSMWFTNLLIRATELEVYFFTYWKPLIRFLTKVSFNGISCNLLNVVTDFIYQRTQRGPQLRQQFQNVLYSDHFSNIH